MLPLLTTLTPIAALVLGMFCFLMRIYKRDDQPAWLDTCDRYFLLCLGVASLMIKGVEWTLTMATGGLLVIYLLLRLFGLHANTSSNYSKITKEYVWLFFAIWLVRSFLVQPYRVPSGSLEPTVYPGDFLLVNQFKYGLRFPVWNKELLPIDTPKRGDIAVFHYPKDPDTLFVKRVIGEPGDHISYHHKKLLINGKEVTRSYVNDAKTIDNPSSVELWDEDLLGLSHQIYVNPNLDYRDDVDVVVPEDHYFVMGDNRDGSHDSRHWGFVSRSHLVGKAMFVWMSVDDVNWRIRLDRIGKWL